MLEPRRQPTLGVIGPMRIAYGIGPDDRVHLSQPGGSALYAAGGARVWVTGVAVLSRATGATLAALSPALSANGIETTSIRLIPGSEAETEFHAITGSGGVDETRPASHFLRVGQPLPKELLAYRPPDRSAPPGAPPGDLAVRLEDLPSGVSRWEAVHLTPMDYFSQATLPGRLQELGLRRITLDPAPGVMDPARRLELGSVLRATDAFLPSEEEVMALYRPRRPDLWECAADLAGMGPATIVIKRGALGVIVWDSTSRSRWIVPAYGAAERDRFGAGDAFCGGFVAGLALTDDPVEAALRGAISASLAIEGTGALYPLGATPRLAEARLEALRQSVRRI